MNSLNIDFRGESLRVLSAKDGVLRHVLVSRNFSLSDPQKAEQQLSAAIEEAGGKKGKVHVILPQVILKYGIFQIPPMDIADAEKVVRRDIAKELGTQDFFCGIRRLIRNRQGRQDILAEYTLRSDIQPYLSLLKKCGISPSVVTTSLEGLTNAFRKIRRETEGNEAVIEIGRQVIEIIVFSNGKIVNYKKVQIPAADNTKTSEKEMDPAQIFKIKMYSIVDALYKFIMETASSSDGDKISRLWISGIGSIEGDTAKVLSESLGLNSALLNPFDTEVEQASMYTAIAGLSMLTPMDQAVNLLPSDERNRGRQFIGKTTIIIVLVFYVILLGGGYFVLNRTEKDLRAMKEKYDADIRTSQKSGPRDKTRQDAIKKILGSNRSLYPLFRDIANLTPQDISLTSLEVEKTAETTFITLGASMQPIDEGLRNSTVSKFLYALEDTGRFALAAPPEITTTATAPNTKKKEFTVKARFEVLQ